MGGTDEKGPTETESNIRSLCFRRVLRLRRGLGFARFGKQIEGALLNLRSD